MDNKKEVRRGTYGKRGIDRIRFSIYVDVETYRQIGILAANDGCSKSEEANRLFELAIDVKSKLVQHLK